MDLTLKQPVIKQFIDGRAKQMQRKAEVAEKKKFEIAKAKADAKAIADFETDFYNFMFEKNIINKSNNTYWINIRQKTEYGFFAQIFLVEGLSFTQLQKEIGNLQECLCCIWNMKVKQFKNYADVQIITTPIDEKFPFEPPKILPHQMYIGMTMSKKPILIDMHKYCQFLLAGTTGSGKTYLLYCMLLAWITGCTPEEINIYLVDIAKDEFNQFEHVKHVKKYISTHDEFDVALFHIMQEFERRKKIIGATENLSFRLL